MDTGTKPLHFGWLKDFLALAESGNFSRAAEERTIAQPALSRHIRGLEEWVGTELIDRSTHPVALTPAGVRFRKDVEGLLERLETARNDACKEERIARRSLSFAATHALSMAFFPRWLGTLESHLPIGPIQMTSDHFRACEELVLQQKVQFLLCHGHDQVPTRLVDADFDYLQLGQDTLVPACTARMAAAVGQAMADGGGTEVPVMLYSIDSGLGHIFRNRVPAVAGQERFRTVFTAHHAVLLKAMALDGRGVAWLPLSLITEELALRKLVVLGDAAWQVPLQIRLFRQRERMAEPAEELWAFITRSTRDASAVRKPARPRRAKLARNP